MNAQTLIVVAIVAAAAMFIARRIWKTAKLARAAKAGCATDCGCEPGGGTKDWAS